MSKLPLEILREKYIPVSEFPEKYGISALSVKKLIDSKQIRPAELKAPGAIRRTLHANVEEVLDILGKEGTLNELDHSRGSLTE